MSDVAGGTSPMPALPCGRDAEALVVQVAEGLGLDAHQQDCPYCRTALTELESLWAPVRAVAGHRPMAPRGALDDALRTLRAVAGDVTEYVRFGHGDGRVGGETTIGDRVVVVLARHLAAQIPGVRAALSRVVAGPTPVVEITLAASYGVDLAALSDRIRAAVARGVREHTGLAAVAVDVVIDDVLEDA